MWNEIKRKLFHLLSLIYVVGLIYLPRNYYLTILVVACVSVFILETLRLKSPRFGAFVTSLFGSLMRDKERTQLSGFFWMLAGVTLTVALMPIVAVAATSLLYLILGDAMAALIGMRFQGPFWPGQKKRISGSLACFATCFLVGVVLLRPDWGWHGVFLGALGATIIEWGVIPIDDNVTIPVASTVVLMLCYGLTPGF